MNIKRRGFFRAGVGMLSMLPFFGKAKAGLPPEIEYETPAIFVRSAIFRGEVPFISLDLNDIDGNPISVGELWAKHGKLSFTGDADKSARVFFDAMSPYLHFQEKPELFFKDKTHETS